MDSSAPILLDTKELGVHFGGIAAISDLSLSVREGEIVSLIGPNGAGKTTIINVVTGFIPPSQGSVSFAGHAITHARPENISAAGLVRTFQNAAVFGNMSVEDNLSIGSFMSMRAGLLQTLFRSSTFRREQTECGGRVDELVEMLELGAYRNSAAKALPYGAQRILGVGIALMAKPKLLALDEPAAGLSPGEARTMGDLIRKINRRGVTIMLIEHNMSLVMSVSDRVIVVKQGRKLSEGTPAEIRKHPDVIEAYLGSEV